MSMRRLCIALVWGGALAFPAAALGQRTIAPPGKSGADQYFETIPSARGNVAPPSGADAGPLSGSAGERRLAHLGKDGQAASALAAATAPPGATARKRPNGSSPGVPGGASSTALRQVINGSDTGGLGLWMPILLAASLVIAVAFVATRRLRRPDTS
jgi:hypothetical protein